MAIGFFLQGRDQGGQDPLAGHDFLFPARVLHDRANPLTEFPSIAYWLARTNPGSKLLPDDFDGQARCLELIDFAVATIHMQGFGRIFRASNYTPTASDEDTVKAKGTEIAIRGFALMDQALEGKQYLCGLFSIADAALFYTEFWAKRIGMTLPANCAAHLERMLARPAVAATLKAEGLG